MSTAIETETTREHGLEFTVPKSTADCFTPEELAEQVLDTFRHVVKRRGGPVLERCTAVRCPQQEQWLRDTGEWDDRMVGAQVWHAKGWGR